MVNRLLLRYSGPSNSFHLYLANLALAMCGTVLLALPVARLQLRVPINNNEGWNAYHADRAISGKPFTRPRTRCCRTTTLRFPSTSSGLPDVPSATT